METRWWYRIRKQQNNEYSVYTYQLPSMHLPCPSAVHP